MKAVLTIARAQELQVSKFSHIRLAGDAFLVTHSVSEAIARLRKRSEAIARSLKRTDRTADVAVWYLDTFYRDDER